MTDAFVNIEVDSGAVSSAASDIAAINAVDSVHVVTGDHDIVATLELADRTDLPTVVADEIHSVAGVSDTVTNVAYQL